MGMFKGKLIVEAAQWFWGCWDSHLRILIILAIVEAFLSIVLADRKRGCLKQRCLQTIAKTMMMFLVVGTVYAIDYNAGENSVLRVITVGYYITYEWDRILEAAVKVGLPIPSSLKNFIQDRYKDHN